MWLQWKSERGKMLSRLNSEGEKSLENALLFYDRPQRTVGSGSPRKNCLISVNYVQAVGFYSKVRVVRSEKCETSSQNVTTPRRFKVKLISASSQHVQRVPLKFLIKTVRDKATSVIKRSASPKVLLTFSSGDVCRYQGILSFPKKLYAKINIHS